VAGGDSPSQTWFYRGNEGGRETGEIKLDRKFKKDYSFLSYVSGLTHLALKIQNFFFKNMATTSGFFFKGNFLGVNF
jgi:hypothetical protein